jgi:3,4-dihydroxy 2-butanone 4-phosphate synthase
MLVSTTHSLHSTDLEGRVAAALDAMRAGVPVILLDDFDREKPKNSASKRWPS